MYLPNTGPQFLDERALQGLADLLDTTPPQVVSRAFEGVETSDVAVFFVICTRFKSGEVSDALEKHAGNLFGALPFEVQVRIAEEIVRIETVDSETAAIIWERQVARIREAIEKTTFLGNGTANLAKLLSHIDLAAQNRLLETLGEKHPSVAESVSEELFRFEDLEGLEDTAIVTVLEVLETSMLALALHKAPTGVRDRFFENMKPFQAEAVEEEMAGLTFEQTQVAETAQQSVVNLVRNFGAKGLLKL